MTNSNKALKPEPSSEALPDSDLSSDKAFTDTAEKVSDRLTHLISLIEGHTTTLRQIISLIGEQGLLLLCALLSLPFLIPVSIPGVSTVFGGAILLIAISITLNRLPWLPKKILDRELETAKLIPMLQKGVGIVSKIDPFVKPRLLGFSRPGIVSQFNGLILIASSILLMLPLSFIPFSNTIPGVAILFLSIGMVQRDGGFVLAGYGLMLATVAYFGVLAWLAFAAGQSLGSLIG
jgi:hypothetical protein